MRMWVSHILSFNYKQIFSKLSSTISHTSVTSADEHIIVKLLNGTPFFSLNLKSNFH
jgi:hypothetical protein